MADVQQIKVVRGPFSRVALKSAILIFASTYASIHGVTDRRPKLLAGLERNAKAVSPDSLHKVLTAFGYEMRGGKGSHRVYTKSGQYPITVPYKRPHVKQYYVKEVISRLRTELEGEPHEEEGNDGSN